MENVIAHLVMIHSRLTEIAISFPEAGVAIDRALVDIDLAARIIEGSQELTACADCGCTVEDGECECPLDGLGHSCIPDECLAIVNGTADLSACEDCGCTVEDGECKCSTDPDARSCYNCNCNYSNKPIDFG